MRSPHDRAKKSPHKQSALLIAILLCVIAFLGQIVGAWYTGSIALLGDTAHVFTDLFSLSLSFCAVILAARPSTEGRSFGLFRLEVLAAFLNGLLLVLVSVGLVWESVQRLLSPHEVLALPLIGVSIFGLVMNLLSALVLSRAMSKHDHDAHGEGDQLTEENPFHLHHGHDHHHHGHDHNHGHSQGDRNLNSALLHVLSDAMGSVAVIAGAVCIYFFHWTWVDPVLGICLSILILRWGAKLLLDSGHVLLEGTPAHIDPNKVSQELRSCDSGILKIEDLHIWEITSSMYAATADVLVKEMSLQDSEELRKKLNSVLVKKYGVAHSVLAIRPN